MITGKCILVKIMPSIQPWLYPNNPSVDRLYIPQSAHILQYQEELLMLKVMSTGKLIQLQSVELHL